MTNSQDTANTSAGHPDRAQSTAGNDHQSQTGRPPSREELRKASKKKIHFDPLAAYKGAFRRLLQIHRHVTGLFMGGIVAYVDSLSSERKRGLRSFPSRFTALLVRPLIKKELRQAPFPTQLRKRLEWLGPTYIKLGQILSLREDILPRIITDELKTLLYRLPEVPFEHIRAIIERGLGGPLEEFFLSVDEHPLGSASIAQTHKAVTRNGNMVVLKVIKPGITDTVETDMILLRWLGVFLNFTIPQYQPRQLISEFCRYTKKEVDLENEADHAEIFRANFHDLHYIRFPEIYREYSSGQVLCMEYLDGMAPDAREALELPYEQRKKIVDRGAEAIIRMLYLDGFFHADLHPGNLLLLPDEQIGFIDLGMVGRFEDRTRRRMLHYFYALVTGDIEGATRHLTSMARMGKKATPEAFERAVSDLLRTFFQHSSIGDFSIAQLIVRSLALGGQHRIFFPVEMTLMTKALVTFEGVGNMLDSKIDVPAISRKHVSSIFKKQFHPAKVVSELVRGLPELADALLRLPRTLADSLVYVEQNVNNRNPAADPIHGLKGSIISGACILAGTLAYVQGGPVLLWAGLLAAGVVLALFNK